MFLKHHPQYVGNHIRLSILYDHFLPEIEILIILDPCHMGLLPALQPGLHLRWFHGANGQQLPHDQPQRVDIGLVRVVGHGGVVLDEAFEHEGGEVETADGFETDGFGHGGPEFGGFVGDGVVAVEDEPLAVLVEDGLWADVEQSG